MDISLYNIDDNTRIGMMRGVPSACVVAGNFLVYTVVPMRPNQTRMEDRLYYICAVVYRHQTDMPMVIVKEQHVERSGPRLDGEDVINSVTSHLKSEGL